MAELDYQYISMLVDHTKEGDSDAFAELYAATYEKQFRFAYRYLKDNYLAQDALQETYILVLKNITKLKDSMLFIQWLNRITFRVCFNLQTKQSRYESELSMEAPLAAAAGNASSMPENRIAEEDQNEYIMKKVRELPFTESQVIIMKYYQNMTIDEIADIIEVSRSTVKRQLASAKKKLGDTIKLD